MKPVIVVIILSIAAIAGTILYTSLTDTKQPLFLDIVDYAIIQESDEPLFLSVTTSEKIPRFLESGSEGYGYGWLTSDSGRLYGYTVNIHSQSGTPKWHAESISISDSEKFCFDDAKVVQSSVVVDDKTLNAVFDQRHDSDFDRVISYEIKSDHDCHMGVAGIISDQISVK